MAFETANPAWFEGAVIYGVIPQMFGEGGFRGVAARLDDLADLGVDALWLSPVNATRAGDFGYAVTDYFALREDYGTTDDFRALIEAAHARGIRVLMDFVPNHTSVEHPWFRDAQERGRASPAYDFYDRDEAGNPTHYFDWVHLPNLNYDNPAVRRTILDAFSSWVRGFDVDGFRVDAAWGVKERRPEFWPLWRQELKAIKPDLLLLAEASARDPYYVANGFDAAYDWTEELGHWAWEDVFAERDGLTARLRAALTADGAGYPADSLILRFLNNNDTGARFVARHGPELTRVAAALLLTLPGLACLYTGDEIGAAYLPYADRLPLDWEEDRNTLRPFYRSLVALRRALPCLRSRAWELLEVEPADQVIAYARYASLDAPPGLVLLNFAGQPAEAVVRVPAQLGRLAGTTLADALGGGEVALRTDPVRAPLPAWGARVLTVERTRD